MRKIIMGLMGLVLVLMSGPVMAGDNLYVHSTEVICITTTTGVSTLQGVPAVAERAMIGVSGNSVYWLAGGMTGRGNDGRGIVLDTTVNQPLVVDGRDLIKSLQFGTCSVNKTTVYAIYLYKP